MKLIHLISSAILPLIALTGCTEIRTKEPFGQAAPLGENDRKFSDGAWYTPTTRRERWNRFTVTTQQDGKATSMVMENAEGKTLTYELQFRKLEEPIVFFRPINRPDEGWQFCWVGRSFNSMDNAAGHANDITLILCLPDEKSFTKLGLKTEKRKVLAPPFGITETPKKESEDYTAALLTESPDEIVAKIKSADFRTFMFPTVPIVLIRHDLLKLTAQSPEKMTAK